MSLRVDPPLEDDLRVRRHLELDGLARDELHRRPLEEACDHQLADVLRERRARRVRGHGVEPKRDRDRDAPVGRREQVGAAVLVDLPVHERRAPVDLLHAVHADVPHAGLAVARDHGRQRDERRGVERPAAHDREEVEVDVVAGQDDLLACPLGDALGRRVGDRLERAELPHLVDEPLRRGQLEHLLELRGDVVEPVDAEREAHPPLGAELVDEERQPRALDVLEEERRPARLDDPIRDLRDLELGVDLRNDAHELVLALEERDPFAEV